MDDTSNIKVKKKREKDYLNNANFCAVLVKWNSERKIDPSILMPNYLGECFIKIVNNYGNRNNFSGYTYLEDMKAEALVLCIKYGHNFNPEISSNAFSYFTQLTHNCFLQVLKKEKQQQELRFQLVKEGTINSEAYDYNNILNEEE